MKNYKAPEVEISIFDMEDIITVSSGPGSGTSSNPDELPDDDWE